MTHSPEPWKVEHNNARYTERIVDSAENTVVLSRRDEFPTASIPTHLAARTEDLRRIVACVNACRGIGTEQLDHGGEVYDMEMAVNMLRKMPVSPNIYSMLLLILENMNKNKTPAEDIL